MSIVERIKNICLTPNTEWPVIANEPSSTGSLIAGYVAPLAAVGAIALFIGTTIVGTNTFLLGTYRSSFAMGLVAAVWSFLGAIIGVVIVGFIINALAPTFGAEQNSARAMKVAVYSFTPAWVAGVLRIIPALGVLAILGAFYGFYLLYLGLPALMKAPKEKAAGYTVVTIVGAIVVMFVVSIVGVTIAGAGAVGSGMLGGIASTSSTSTSPGAGEVQFDKNSPMGKLQEFGKAMEESNKKMEAAQKSGDANATAAAAMDTLGTLFGGGKKVDPLEIDQIKSFLPPTLAGFSKQGNGTAEKSGFASLMVSKAEANYSDGTKTVNIGISDSGGASGIMGLAGWAAMQTSKEDDNGSERVTKVNGRLVHEQTRKNGDDEFEIILGDRFIVSASSRDVKLNQLKTIVSALDLNKIESMKDVGVKK
jgi:Yip1-like protein